jgi:ribosomal protein S3AE
MKFFDVCATVCLRKEEIEQIIKICDAEPELYPTVSYFIRAAVCREIRRMTRQIIPLKKFEI